MKKAQAGLDFLMTYGWALLLIVLVVGALFALGIFDIGNFLGNRVAGFSNIGVNAWRVADDGVLTVKFSNKAGTDINITNINATYNTDTLNYSTPVQINNGKESGTITVGTFPSPGSKGSSYTVTMAISYTDKKTGFQYGDSGTITGKIE